MKTINIIALIATIGSISISGCGGGSSVPGGSSAAVSVFATDSFRDDYKQVWGTIFKAELLDSSNSAKTIFEDATGKTFNFSGLHDGSGSRYAFLSEVSLPAASYTRLRLTMSKTLSIVPTASNSAQSKEIKGDAATDPNQVIVVVDLPAPKTFSGGDEFAIDFDLANFSFDGAKVVPSIKEGNKNGLDDLNRHEDEDSHGVISTLAGTAPTQTFELNLGEFGRLVKVRTSAQTSIFNRSGLPSPLLASGKRVEVRGVYDNVTKELLASSVKIEDSNGGGGHDDANEAKGNVPQNTVNVSTGLFSITVSEVHGFITPGTSLPVAVTESTTYRNNGGVTRTKAEFFAEILANPRLVEVEGTFSTQTGIFTATKCKIDIDEDNNGDGGNDDSVEAKGPYGSSDVTAGTITFTVTEYEGWSFSGGTIVVTTDSNIVYQGNDNNTLTKSAYFTGLPGKTVKVNGELVNGKILAKRLRYSH